MVDCQRHPAATLSPGKTTGTQCTGSWVGPGPDRMSAQNLIPTGIRIPDRSAREGSLYQLRYPDPEAVGMLQNVCEPARSLAIYASR